MKRGAVLVLVVGLLLCAPASAGPHPRLGLSEARRLAAGAMRNDWMPYLGAGHVKIWGCERRRRDVVACRGLVDAKRGTCTFRVTVRNARAGYAFQLYGLRCE